MVSQLSARLMGTFSLPSRSSGELLGTEQGSTRSAGSGSSSSRSSAAPACKRGGTYASDTASLSSKRQSLPDYINLSPSSSTAGGADHRDKRRKIAENNYAASRVKEDLSRGGIPYPQVSTLAAVLATSCEHGSFSVPLPLLSVPYI